MHHQRNENCGVGL